MRGRTQGKKVHARSQRVQDYHQKQMPGDLWPLLKTRGLGGDYWLMIAALSGGNPHILPLKVSHPLKLSTPNLKV